MTIDEIIKLAESRLSYLNSRRASANSVGDFEEIEKLDKFILETESTLSILKKIK